MHELYLQVLTYIRGSWRYRWYMMLVAWLVCVVGWGYIQQMPDQYEASARVHVDTQSILQPLLRGSGHQYEYRATDQSGDPHTA